MKLILDEREAMLYDKCDSIVNNQGNTTSIQLSKQMLSLGDILVKTDEDREILIIERKSLQDLLSSIKDGRYEEQSHRLIHSSGFHPHNIIYVIEGQFSQLRSIMEKKIVYSAITSLNYFKGFSVFRTGSVQETAELVVWVAEKLDRDFCKGKVPSWSTAGASRLPKVSVGERPNSGTLVKEFVNIPNHNLDIDSTNEQLAPTATTTTIPNYCSVVKKVKKENITPENIGEIILSQIPGISSVSAIAIMKKFANFPQLMEKIKIDPDCLNDIVCESKGKVRKLSKAVIKSIQTYLVAPAIGSEQESGDSRTSVDDQRDSIPRTSNPNDSSA